jgi:hypothetical protein
MSIDLRRLRDTPAALKRSALIQLLSGDVDEQFISSLDKILSSKDEVSTLSYLQCLVS